MRRFATLFVGLLLLVSTAGVAPATAASAQTTDVQCTFPVTLTDATGTEITLEERPERVVTTNPSAAQTMWGIGGRDQVVGLTQYASYLEGADSRANVSAGFGVNVEKVVGANPDLVIAPNASAGDVQALRDAGLKVYHLPAATSVEDISEKTTTVGRLTGNCEGAAEANAWMNANVDAVENASAEAGENPEVLYAMGGGYVAADGTFIDALFETVGADNVAARDHTGYPQLSDEVLLQLDPEVLVVTEGMTGLVNQEPYASTTAGQTNSTVVLQTRDLNQPAPRSVVHAVHNLSSQLYPERYDEGSYVPRSAVTTGTDNSTASPTETGASPSASTSAAEPDANSPASTTGGDGPGFTAVATLLAIVAAAAMARGRE
ncbi:PGF-CTERM-anchored ABC transporter substrate-binding protein [Haloarcula nitratireducens]|uniref:Helical backbone metal receptor n=1 Tax=Haloarcula nitratireducens TaxID=2487749 RepID=A0AAW4PBA5_9EURY|nr:PGF-CTERM-anchored ABC transporter substrate-binding protein [Halomicroarcula nitratireducens]MBX0295016.1 helical backbone metal receptor [Halomicroarcula nitratireducens]